jgi:hypothetical protein
MGCAMSEEHTTAVVQRYLDELAEDSPAEPIVRTLLDRWTVPSAGCTCCAPRCCTGVIRV